MVKKAAKYAVWIAVGTTVGGCLLPRLYFRELYNASWPPVWKEALLYFGMGFVAAFSVLLLLFRIKEACLRRKQPAGAARYRDAAAIALGNRPLFTSTLPLFVDWAEVNDFLRATRFDKQLLMDKWRDSDAFTAHPVSDTSMACLQCLHEDLAGCYRGAFAFDENGQEDRHEEYRLLREHLHAKYDKIDADLLERIYLHYLQEDR